MRRCGHVCLHLEYMMAQDGTGGAAIIGRHDL